MATRPSVPASLNNSNAVAANAKSIWLAETNANMVDFKGFSPDLARTGSYTFDGSDSVLGGAIFRTNGVGSNGLRAGASSQIGATINTFPVCVGAIFYCSSTPTAASKVAILCDSTYTSGSALLSIEVQTTGEIRGVVRTSVGGTVRYISGPTLTANTQYAVGFLWSGNNSGALVVNGTAYTTVNGTHDGWTSSFGYFAQLNHCHGGTTGTSSSGTESRVSLGWYGTSNISQSDLETWTADPWDMFGASAATGVPKSTKSLLLGVG